MNPSGATPIPDADVHAYVDGQLAPERAAAIEAALMSDPELAAGVAALRGQNATLRDALDRPDEARRRALAGGAIVRERFDSDAAFARLVDVLSRPLPR